MSEFSLTTTICANRKTLAAIYCRFSSQHIRLALRGQAGTRISLAAADLSSCGTTQEIRNKFAIAKSDLRECSRIRGLLADSRPIGG